MNKFMSESSPQSQVFLRVFRALVVLIIIGFIGVSVYNNTVQPDSEKSFKLGLDLAGGSHLVYEADVSGVDALEVPELMSVLRDVIERRVNIFGVSEPIVQVESSSFVTDEPIQRLVVELPGVTDVGQAVAEIGRTPLLEFKLLDRNALFEQDTIDSLAYLI